MMNVEELSFGERFDSKQKKEDELNSFSSEKEESICQWGELSWYLNSDEVINKIKNCPEKIRPNIIGKIIEFSSFFKDVSDLDCFLADLVKIDVESDDEYCVILVKYIAKKLYLTETKSLVAKRQIFDFFNNNFLKKGVYFHGFNGVFESEIINHGVSANKRLWDNNELSRMEEIFAPTGRKMILGWNNINSQGSFFVAGVADNLYNYAVASPEWFAQFVGEGWHVSGGKKEKQCFYYRDYDTAKKNIIALCQSAATLDDRSLAGGYRPISLEETVEVMNFFEKYWKLLVNEKSIPKALLISRAAVSGQSGVTTFDNYCAAVRLSPEDTDVATILSYARPIREVDVPITKDIDVGNFKIVDLPDYSKIFPE